MSCSVSQEIPDAVVSQEVPPPPTPPTQSPPDAVDVAPSAPPPEEFETLGVSGEFSPFAGAVGPPPVQEFLPWPGPDDPNALTFLGVMPPQQIHHQEFAYNPGMFIQGPPPPPPTFQGQLYFDVPPPPMIAVTMPPPPAFPPFIHHDPNISNMHYYGQQDSLSPFQVPPPPQQQNHEAHFLSTPPPPLPQAHQRIDSSQFVPSSWEELGTETSDNSSGSGSNGPGSSGSASPSPRLVEYVGDQYHDKNPHTRRTIILNPQRSSKNDPVVFYRFYQFSCSCMGKVWFSPLHRAKDGCFCRDCHRFVKPFGYIDGLTPYMGHELCYGKFECHVCGRSWSCQKSRSNFPDNCFNCTTIVYPYYQVSHSVLRKKILRHNPSAHFLRHPSYSDSSSLSCEEELEGLDFNGDFHSKGSKSPVTQQKGHSSCIVLPVCGSKGKVASASHSDPLLNNHSTAKHDSGRAGFRNHRK